MHRQKRVAMKHELYLKEQEVMQKKLAESIAENLQKQKTRKDAQYMKMWQEVEVRLSPAVAALRGAVTAALA